MFVDKINIYIKAGDGGNGAVSFRREKNIPAGGPDGGDGGHGGNIYFIASRNLSTLVEFKYKKKYFAQDGEIGAGQKCSGKQGEDLYIKVPLGTLVKDRDTGRLIADISKENDSVLIVKAGKGGWGNTRFKSATRQIPRFSKNGTTGEEANLTLELKLLADVGLVGFPNVGKSTLISVLSGAKPKIANYHFTTLTPVLGVVSGESIGDYSRSYIMADIPGLIEGAAEGVGLGHDFLRHVERCRLIIHIVDVSGIEGRDPQDDFEKINIELKKFNEDLSKRPQIVVGNKSDMASPKQIEEFKEYIEKSGYKFFDISAVTHQGIDALNKEIFNELAKLPPIINYEPEEAPVKKESDDKSYTITLENGVYYIEAPWLARILDESNINDYESLQYFQRILVKSGIVSALEDEGIEEDNVVNIDGYEFNFMP